MDYSMKTVQGVLRCWHTVESQELAFEVESVYLLPRDTPIPRLFKNHIRAKLNVNDNKYSAFASKLLLWQMTKRYEIAETNKKNRIQNYCPLDIMVISFSFCVNRNADKLKANIDIYFFVAAIGGIVFCVWPIISTNISRILNAM